MIQLEDDKYIYLKEILISNDGGNNNDVNTYIRVRASGVGGGGKTSGGGRPSAGAGNGSNELTSTTTGDADSVEGYMTLSVVVTILLIIGFAIIAYSYFKEDELRDRQKGLSFKYKSKDIKQKIKADIARSNNKHSIHNSNITTTSSRNGGRVHYASPSDGEYKVSVLDNDDDNNGAENERPRASFAILSFVDNGKGYTIHGEIQDTDGFLSKSIIDNGLASYDGIAYWEDKSTTRSSFGIDIEINMISQGRFDFEKNTFSGIWESSIRDSGRYTSFELVRHIPNSEMAALVVDTAPVQDEKQEIQCLLPTSSQSDITHNVSPSSGNENLIGGGGEEKEEGGGEGISLTRSNEV